MSINRYGVLLLVAASTGCMATYRVQPAEYVAAHNPSQILVLDNGGTIHLVDGPSMKGDTLTGIESGTPDSLALPVDQVEDAMVRRVGKGRTAMLVSGLTAGVGMAVVAIVTQGKAHPCKPAGNKKDTADPNGTNTCDTTHDTIIENPY